MDTQRAQEIAESPTMVNVTHNGVQIYIQRVDAENQLARIFPLGNPENEQEVPLSNLEEH